MAKFLYEDGAPPGAVDPKASPSGSPIANFWFALFQTADAQGKAILEWSAPFWDPRLVQKKWLAAWGQAMDGYLRSTAFLEFIRQCTKTSAPGASNGSAIVLHDEIVEGDSHR
jgi:hypothetical protein